MTVSTSPSKHTVHSPFLLPAGSGGGNTGDTGGLSGELGAVTAERKARPDLSNVVLRWVPLGQPQEGQSFYGGTHGEQLQETPTSAFCLGFAPFLPPSIRHHHHPLGSHIWMLLFLPAECTAEEGEDAGVRGVAGR